MKDHQKSKEQLVREVVELRRQIQAARTSDAEHKQTDGRLHSVHRKLRAVFDAIQDGICAVDLDFNLTDVNAGMLKAFDLPDKESALGRKCFEVFRGREENCLCCTVLDAYRTKAPVCRMATAEDLALADDRIYEISAYPILDEEGEPVGAVRFARDISERKRAEEALRESEARFRSLVENMPDYVVVVDHQGKILFTNRTPEEAGEQKLIGTIGFSHMAPQYQQRCHDALERALATGDVQPLEVRSKYGGWWDCRLVPILEDRTHAKCMVICADISHRKEVEEAVQQKQRQFGRLLDMHERDRRLVAYEIHDGFVQPLTAAKMVFEGHLCILQDTYPDAVWHDCGKALQLLDRSIKEARQLINGQRPMILDEMGLVPAVSHLINDHRGDGSPIIEYSHQVEFDRLASPLETAVFRIIQESLANVLRHSNSPKVRIGMVQRGDRIRVEIEDWGIGFDPLKVETSRFGLEGLRQRARLLGGQATIDSAPGKGTRVTVELPLVQGVL